MKSSPFEALGKEHTLSSGPDEIVADNQIGINRKGANRSIILIVVILVCVAVAGGFFYQNFANTQKPPASFLEQPVEQSQIQTVDQAQSVATETDPAINPASEGQVADLGPAGIALQELQQQAVQIPSQPASQTVEVALPTATSAPVSPSANAPMAPIADVQTAVVAPQVEAIEPIKPVQPAPKPVAKPKPAPKPKPKPKPVEKAQEQEIEEPVTSERILIFSE